MSNSMSRRLQGILVGVGASLILAAAISAPAADQDKTITKTAGVDNTAMGAYRALARLTLQAFSEGDHARAAELARILERTWDKGEEGGGERSLIKLNKSLFEQIDKAMDAFIKPIIAQSTIPPTADSVEGAYKIYLEKLREGDAAAK